MPQNNCLLSVENKIAKKKHFSKNIYSLWLGVGGGCRPSQHPKFGNCCRSLLTSSRRRFENRHCIE